MIATKTPYARGDEARAWQQGYDAAVRDAAAAVEAQREQFRRVTGTPKGDVMDLVYHDAARTVEMLLAPAT